FFSEAGHAFEHQPSRGLDELLGAKQGMASFGPDMWHRLELSSDGGRLAGGVYRQSYLPTHAKPFAYYDDGLVAGVENAFGAGKVRAIGTMAGYGYKLNPKPEYLRFFAAALPFAGMSPLIRADYNTGLIARLWADAENTFLWCLNERSYPQHVILRPDGAALRFTGAEALRGGDPDIKNGLLHFELPGRDAAIYKLK
ncbi:MAG: hypothetical protein LBU58_08395, partial [Clostridiales bacterium]|nr:hypothetical protein [Clostridiales bacterium]